ncbi:10193_t:CDS:2 [Funneliformis mosseae]|uniref:10193_t:CDS:1 n=1 Tax=Funneliformis mosseae TaxID=27381 RepID=A0A9N9BGI9_FUNMO|nr:10193_t:CDS:2 [Funneliformis mosseae]
MKAFSNLVTTRQYAIRFKRFNEAGVEMLLRWLHEKIFPDNSSNVPVKAEIVEIALKYLKHQGLKRKETENFPMFLNLIYKLIWQFYS